MCHFYGRPVADRTIMDLVSRPVRARERVDRREQAINDPASFGRLQLQTFSS